MTVPNPATAGYGFPPQHQGHQPGIESEMSPLPQFENPNYQATGKLSGKTAIVTGGDSGIGRAVAVSFAREKADVVIVYLNEHNDAMVTRERIEELGQRCILVPGNVGDTAFCRQVVEKCITNLGRIDIVVNNAGEQHPQPNILEISEQQLEQTFRTNIFSFFFMTQAALKHLQPGSSIINTSSITAYKGHKELIDYSATKGAVTTFTRSLSESLIGKGIRVNAVAPGPIWTPLIPSTFTEQGVVKFGTDTPMMRAGQPFELAEAYVYLASDDSSYMSGQVLHVNGGVIVNG